MRFVILAVFELHAVEVPRQDIVGLRSRRGRERNEDLIGVGLSFALLTWQKAVSFAIVPTVLGDLLLRGRRHGFSERRCGINLVLSLVLVEKLIINTKLDVDVLLVGNEGRRLVLPDVVVNLSLLEAGQVVVDDQMLER